ncbi:MAG: IS3 family transposase [Bacilli bacterium]|nr:IS3 family transposase [Bacilli bacterium]
MPDLPQGTTREKVTFINLYKDNYKLYNMCVVLEISLKTYYKYRNKENPDYYDYLIIKEIFDDSKGTYGYRRIVEGLKIKYVVVMNGKKVLRIMKKYNLVPMHYWKSKKKNKYTRNEENVKPNLVNRKFDVDKENKIWTTDITYLIFKGTRAYLSTILDLYDRKVIAYKISKHNDIKLVTDTLNEAIAKRKDVSGVILHSDQGFQYTSYEYKAICESNSIQISMSRKGTPIDDSPMENWHALLKKETLYNNNISSLQEYIQLVEDWILFYNTNRIKGKKRQKRKTYTKREK